MNLDKTEQIKLKDSKTAISFGLDCDVDKSGTKVEDILNFSVQYLIYQKDSSGNKKKII